MGQKTTRSSLRGDSEEAEAIFLRVARAPQRLAPAARNISLSNFFYPIFSSKCCEINTAFCHSLHHDPTLTKRVPGLDTW